MFTFNYNEELEKAVYQDNIERVQALLPIGPYVRHRFIKSYQFALLHYTSSVKIARHLLLCGADVNATSYKTDETPLFTAITLGRSPQLIVELLNHGASARARNRFTMNSPLNHAVQRRDCNVSVVKVLIDYGAVVNTANLDCDSPLNNAVRNHRPNLDVIKLLLSHDAAVNSKNLKGNAPLNSAVRNSHCTVELVKELLKYKVNVNTFNCEGNTPLHYAATQLPNFKLDIVKELIKHGARINIENYEGITSLDCAVRNQASEADHLAYAKLFIKYTLLNEDNTPSDIKIDHYTGQVYRTLSAHISDCIFELARMKREKIDENLSLYNYILLENGNKDINEKLFNILSKFAYPVYNDLIFAKIKRVGFLNKLIQQEIFTFIFREKGVQRIKLDTYSVYHLAKYLSNDELRNLAIAFYDSKKLKDLFLQTLSSSKPGMATKLDESKEALCAGSGFSWCIYKTNCFSCDPTNMSPSYTKRQDRI